ncbi:MAG TPA: PfkB family carbohydrate kinase [Streptosporangiaceae bacterium]
MSQRILVVALNAALDITHELERVDWSGVNRPGAVLTRPGGKGLNVARTLHVLGAEVLVTGLLGGRTGHAVAAALAETGLAESGLAEARPTAATLAESGATEPGATANVATANVATANVTVATAFTWIAGETRRTFAVVDSARGQTALFNEPGPLVSAREYLSFRVRYEAELARCAVVVLTGSLPRGLPEGSYGELIQLAAQADVPVVLDAEGQALRRGVVARPTIVKPNLAELEGAVGRSLGDPNRAAAGDLDEGAVMAAAAELRGEGAQAVVVSLGAHGLLAATSDGGWRAVPPARAGGNPTGAGDAVVAGLAHQLLLGRPWTERLRHATALGSAAAAAPAAGEFGLADYRRALAEVRVSRIAAAR